MYVLLLPMLNYYLYLYVIIMCITFICCESVVKLLLLCLSIAIQLFTFSVTYSDTHIEVTFLSQSTLHWRLLS